MRAPDAVPAAFAGQIAWCDRLVSPFTARLLALLADDIGRDGPTAGLVGGWPGDPEADALPLRLAGALHALALSGAAPALAAAYPPRAATPCWPAVREALVQHETEIRQFLASPPQTNEVGRSAVLLGGFLTVAAATGLPLRLLEIGASAGLNLVWDRYRYRLGAATWGDAASPLELAPAWSGPLPPLDAPLAVAARAACDVAPLDLADAAQRLRLCAYVWADQRGRLARLETAIAIAGAAGYSVERADAAVWVGAQLAAPVPGMATVVFHSVMWQYMPPASRATIAATIAQAGARATPAAPVAWLRFEPPAAGAAPELRLTLWPDGRTRHLAVAHAHGSSVAWAGG